MRSILLIFLLSSLSYAKVAGPIYTHAEREQKEFEHLYKAVNTPPTVIISTAPPAIAPSRVGDIFIDTTNKKVYFSTAAVTSSSWLVVN